MIFQISPEVRTKVAEHHQLISNLGICAFFLGVTIAQHLQSNYSWVECIKFSSEMLGGIVLLKALFNSGKILIQSGKTEPPNIKS